MPTISATSPTPPKASPNTSAKVRNFQRISRSTIDSSGLSGLTQTEMGFDSERAVFMYASMSSCQLSTLSVPPITFEPSRSPWYCLSPKR